MEDVLDVYTHEQDSHRPLVRMDECPKRLIGETGSPIPDEPGKPSRFDTEYVRTGRTRRERHKPLPEPRRRLYIVFLLRKA
jgi:hypothetical protein